MSQLNTSDDQMYDVFQSNNPHDLLVQPMSPGPFHPVVSPEHSKFLLNPIQSVANGSNQSSPLVTNDDTSMNLLNLSFNSFFDPSPGSAKSLLPDHRSPNASSSTSSTPSQLQVPNPSFQQQQPFQSSRALFSRQSFLEDETFTQRAGVELKRGVELLPFNLLTAKEQSGTRYAQKQPAHDALTDKPKFSRGHNKNECIQQLFVDDQYLWGSRSAIRICHLESPFSFVVDEKDKKELIMWRACQSYGQSTQKSQFKFTQCVKAVRPAIVDPKEEWKNFTGWTLSHELCNLNRSLHTLTIDVAIILTPAEAARLKKRRLAVSPLHSDVHSQDVRLNLNFQMVYEPSHFLFARYSMCSSASMLNSKCNTFLREPSSTVYIVLQPEYPSADFGTMLNEYLLNTRLLDIKIAILTDGINDVTSHRDYSSTVLLSTTGNKSVYRRVCDLACQLFVVFAKRMKHSQYLPHFVLVGCQENLHLCHVFFQMWQRLQTVSQLRHIDQEIEQYCTHHDMERDWLLLLAKSHFFARLARPELSLVPFNRFCISVTEEVPRHAVEALGSFARDQDAGETMLCAIKWITKTKQPNCRLATDFCLSIDRFDATNGLLPNGMTPYQQFNEEIYKTATARYCPPVVLDSTVGNGPRQLQLYYLLMNARNPYPFGTFDVEAAAAMSRFLRLYPRMASMDADVEGKLRSIELSLYQQWYFSALEPFNLSKKNSGYPMGQLFGFSRPDFNFHDRLIRICGTDVPIPNSPAISFEPIRWDLSLPCWIKKYAATCRGKTTVIQRVAASVSTAYGDLDLRPECRNVCWDEKDGYNTWILLKSQAEVMPYYEDLGIDKLLQVGEKQKSVSVARQPAEL